MTSNVSGKQRKGKENAAEQQSECEATGRKIKGVNTQMRVNATGNKHNGKEKHRERKVKGRKKKGM